MPLQPQTTRVIVTDASLAALEASSCSWLIEPHFFGLCLLSCFLVKAWMEQLKPRMELRRSKLRKGDEEESLEFQDVTCHLSLPKEEGSNVVPSNVAKKVLGMVGALDAVRVWAQGASASR